MGRGNIFELKIPDEEIILDGFNNHFGYSYTWQFSYHHFFQKLHKLKIIEKLPPNNWDRYYCNNGEFVRNRSIGVLFDISGWEKGIVNKEALKYSNGYDNQRVYSRRIGDYKLNLHLLFQSVKDKIGIIRKENSHEVSEKEIFERNIESFERIMTKYFKKNNIVVNIIGIHPIYVEDYCHFACTYSMKIIGVGEKYMRKYIINLPSKTPDEEHEIIITAYAGYKGKKVSKNQFLQVMPVFDQFVYSMRYDK